MRLPTNIHKLICMHRVLAENSFHIPRERGRQTDKDTEDTLNSLYYFDKYFCKAVPLDTNYNCGGYKHMSVAYYVVPDNRFHFIKSSHNHQLSLECHTC